MTPTALVLLYFHHQHQIKTSMVFILNFTKTSPYQSMGEGVELKPMKPMMAYLSPSLDKVLVVKAIKPLKGKLK
jgi:hypothetical protein